MSKGSKFQSINTFLKDLRINCSKRNIPIISKETESYINKYLHKNKPKYVLEIGSAVAYSTIMLANNVKQRDGQVYSLEISYKAYLEGLNNIKQSGLKNILLYPFDANKINLKKLIPKKINFAFIDGQKNQYANYLTKIQDICVSDGVVILDDVIRYHNKLDSLYRYLQKKQIIYQTIATEPGDGILRFNW